MACYLNDVADYCVFDYPEAKPGEGYCNFADEHKLTGHKGCIHWVEFPIIEEEDESSMNRLTIDLGNARLQLNDAQAQELYNALKEYLGVECG